MTLKVSARKLLSIMALILFLPLSYFYAEEPPKPITIVVINSNPFSFKLPDGSLTGLYVDFWRLWSETNSIPINIIMMPLADSLKAVENNEAVHAGLFMNDKRAEYANFSLPIHSVTTGVIYGRGVSSSLKLADLKDLKIATQVASFQANFIQRMYPDLNLSFYDGLENGLIQLFNNEIQVVVAEIPNLNSQISKLGFNGVFTYASEKLLINRVHALIGKGQPKILEQINKGIENIPIRMLIELEQKWLPGVTPFFKDFSKFDALTITEKKWLQNNNKFSLGIDTSWIPFDFTDEKGVFSGISADYVGYANNLLDINVEPVVSSSWLNALKAFNSGNIDIMSAIVRTPDRQKILNLTEPYFMAPTVIVTRKNSFYAETITSLNGKTLGLIKDYPLIELVARDYPLINIKPVNSVEDALEQLQSGSVDAFINTIAVINDEMNNNQITDLNIAGLSPYKFEISMAVRDGLEPLVPILNKAFANMTEKEKAGIANNWLAVRIQTGTELKTLLYWVFPAVSLLLLIIFIIVRVNRRLESEIISRELAEKERHSLESQLHQSQKMEALGKLTGGVAHDFNNILGVIQGYSELLESQLPKVSKLTDYARHIHNAGIRGATLTKRLLSFTQKHPIDATKVNINSLLLEQQDMMQKTLTVRIKLILELTDELWTIKVDKNELGDTLLNMCINAMHAMRSRTEGALLSIRTANKSINEIDAKSLVIPAGDYVQLEIIDNGCGMDSVVKDKIFDPFFTTKGNQGTGLGLSQVFGFVQRSNGSINVKSKVEQGSQFIMYFPRFIVVEDQEEQINKNNSILGGNETILIVDDEASLRELAFELLAQQGYKIITAGSGKEALDVLLVEKVDLMLSDVIMPEMDGYRLARIVREMYPTIKIQMVSGFSEKRQLDSQQKDLHENIIDKPYNARKLYTSIRSLLDNNS